jgi:general secretion pathway protein B
MSLILDALKKSEAERQRQSGPTLLEVRVSQPRRRYPTWVIAVGILLAVNIVLLLAFVLHRPATPVQPSAPAVAAAAAPAAAAAVPTSTAGSLPASVAPLPAASVAAPAVQPVADSADAGALVPVPKTFSRPDAVADSQNGVGNPADDEPAVPAGGGHYGSLPSFNDVGGDLPQLRLDLHVYAERARDSYALINMHKVHEGDTLPEGPRVLAITREGVALDYRSQQFMLRPQ